jgi:replication-associated recombination protein RarA
MVWYSEYGYKKNPFSIKPTDTNNLIGYEKVIHRLIYQIKIGNIIFLEGNYGTGKSSILKYIMRKIKSKIIYFNCSSNKNLKKSLMKTRSLLRKLLMLKPNRIVLLLDETHLADPTVFDFLYEFYIMDRIKSIVFAGTDFKNVPFNKAFKSDTKIYRLDEIRNNLAIEIIKARIPKQKLINSPLAKKIFALSDKNPRTYLENLEDIFRKAHALNQKRLTKKDIDEFFGKLKRQQICS